MIAAIAAALGPAVALVPASGAALSDIFEAYVFSLVIAAARAEGAVVAYQDVNGASVSNLLFRTSPGNIYSTAHPYTHAVLQFNSKPPLETHVGVMVAGKSTVLHEADVMVLQKSEAETCRRGKVPPRSSKLVLAVECKFYGSLLQLGVARSFLGLVSDFSADECFFVTNTTSTSVERLLSRRRASWEKNIVPTASGDVERLLNAFKTAFKEYKAR